MLGGVIINCAPRRNTEEVAQFLQAKGTSAGYFHAELPPGTKKYVQASFNRGELRAITATNAFGMGIDPHLSCRFLVFSDSRQGHIGVRKLLDNLT